MNRTVKLLPSATLALLVGSGLAQGQVLVEEIGPAYLPTDISSDGSVVVGNIQGPYETFYWTSQDGPLPLGRATVPVLGRGAGTPDVSDDGTRVSATILTDDDQYITQGIWDIDNGWQTLMPPIPPDGGLLDLAYGSAWGISGDGQAVVGLYWRPNNAATGSAHPSVATLAGGVVDLGTPHKSGRANAANYDASVIGGWTERPDGTWEPTVWVDGVMTVLGDFEASSTVEDVNRDGTVLVGDSYTHPNGGATIWRRNGPAWDRQYVGGLPDLVALSGNAWFGAVSGDGELAVGASRAAFGAPSEGMLWSEDLGLWAADDWLAALGAAPALPLIQLTAVSGDGKTITAILQAPTPPFGLSGIVIRCVSDGDADGDGDVDLRDAAMLQRGFTGRAAGAVATEMQALDFNCDLDIDLADLAEFTDRWSGPRSGP